MALHSQGLPEGHTEACFPVLPPGLGGHRGTPLRDVDADQREAKRFALIGNGTLQHSYLSEV